jgi:hypothetical protein
MQRTEFDLRHGDFPFFDGLCPAEFSLGASPNAY